MSEEFKPEPRTKNLRISVTPTEHRMLKERAYHAGYTISEYVRRAALGEPRERMARPVDPVLDRD